MSVKKQHFLSYVQCTHTTALKLLCISHYKKHIQLTPIINWLHKKPVTEM